VAFRPLRRRSRRAVARDLTVTKRFERDAHFAAVVATSDDAIISRSLDGTVVTWNPAAEGLFGYAASEMVGQSVRMLIPDDRQHEEDEVLSRIRLGQKLDHYATVRRRTDGTLVPVSLTVSPVLDERGVVIGASKIARDITERARADQERRRLLEIARAANRLKTSFSPPCLTSSGRRSMRFLDTRG
jgi:PAS domain S-box-containing protein